MAAPVPAVVAPVAAPVPAVVAAVAAPGAAVAIPVAAVFAGMPGGDLEGERPGDRTADRADPGRLPQHPVDAARGALDAHTHARARDLNLTVVQAPAAGIDDPHRRGAGVERFAEQGPDLPGGPAHAGAVGRLGHQHLGRADVRPGGRGEQQRRQGAGQRRELLGCDGRGHVLDLGSSLPPTQMVRPSRVSSCTPVSRGPAGNSPFGLSASLRSRTSLPRQRVPVGARAATDQERRAPCSISQPIRTGGP